MKTAYLSHLCLYALPLLALLSLLLWRRDGKQTGAVLRAIAPPILIVAAWLTAADHVAISQGIWVFGEGKHLGVYLGAVPIEEALFFLMTNSLVGVALSLFVGHFERLSRVHA
ncbi:MAG: lycopene cyclase domain-containing protein [Deltaproteobacteria bacterium]|nr:lycopene cyclase domain-containing protein [Deltaproteobacteria bacterium]